MPRGKAKPGRNCAGRQPHGIHGLAVEAAIQALAASMSQPSESWDRINHRLRRRRQASAAVC